MKRLSLFVMAALMSLSCMRVLHEESPPAVQVDAVTEDGVRPVEEAVATLQTFLRETQTKTMETGYRIKSVETHYRTVESETGCLSVPDAYIVQYEDAPGFAVLGAHKDVDDIVAIIENGRIDAESLSVSIDNDTNELASFVEGLIKTGLKGKKEGSRGGDQGGNGGEGGEDDLEDDEPFIDPEIPAGVGGGGLPPSYQYATRLPLLGFSWDQDSPYNDYCYDPLGFLQGPVCTGCSVTAMAMIVAAVEYPQTLVLNGTVMNWSEMKSQYRAGDFASTSTAPDQIAKLMGYIFNSVVPIPLAFSEGTFVLPEAIKNLMQNLGYENVKKMSANTLNFNMIGAISDMLRDYKPVFISAVPSEGVTHSHSWVIDGAKYTSFWTYLLHFNFGWSGNCNGYFSYNCLNPSQGYEYDNPNMGNNHNNTYTWHFRVITYDVPWCQSTVYLTFDTF